MFSNYFTVTIITQGAFGVAKIKIYKILYILILALFFSFLGFLGLSYYSYFQTKNLYSSHQELQREFLQNSISYKIAREKLLLFNNNLKIFKEFDEKIRAVAEKKDFLNFNSDKIKIEVNSDGKFNRLLESPSLYSRLDNQEKNIINEIRNTDLNYKIRQLSFIQLEKVIRDNHEKIIRTPSIHPLKKGIFTSGFGLRKDPFTGNLKFHKGIDWAAPPYTPIYAPADGIVVYSYYESSYGNLLAINHGYGIVTRYAHLKNFEIKPGQRVKRGNIIARVGDTGNRSIGNHLHYEIIVKGKHADPLNFIINNGIKISAIK